MKCGVEDEDLGATALVVAAEAPAGAVAIGTIWIAEHHKRVKR